MKIQNLIEKDFEVDAVSVDKDQIKNILAGLKDCILKLDKIPTVIDLSKKYKGIKIISSVSKTHLVLMNRKVEGSITVKLSLGYSFYTAHEVLSLFFTPPPSSFETVGDVVHMNLKEEYLPYKYLIGEVIHDKTSALVINKLGNINNTFRNFEFEIIGGSWLSLDKLKEISKSRITLIEDNGRVFRIKYKCDVEESNELKGCNQEISNLLKDITISEITIDALETVHFENGLEYIIDIKNCYWCSKLQAERQRLLNELKEGEVFCDVFCGVGPMVLPALRKGCSVICNDLNPYAVDCLKRSLKRNKLESSQCEIYNLDAGEFLSLNRNKKIDHFFLNLPEHSLEYLKNLKEYKGDYKVHCYFFCNDNISVIDYIYSVTGFEYQEDQVVQIRKVSPSKNMYKLTC